LVAPPVQKNTANLCHCARLFFSCALSTKTSSPSDVAASVSTCPGKSTCQTVRSSSSHGPLCSIDHLVVGRGGVAWRAEFRRRSGHVVDGHLSCLARWSHVHLLLAVHKRFVDVFMLVFALFSLGDGPQRGLDLPGHFSEDHGKISRFSHISKEVDARWSARATKHIGEEKSTQATRERKVGQERQRERERNKNTNSNSN